MQTVAALAPHQVVSASANPDAVPSPTQATWPSGRTSTAAGAVTAPITGSSQAPSYDASTSCTRSAQGPRSTLPAGPKLTSTGRAVCSSV